MRQEYVSLSVLERDRDGWINMRRMTAAVSFTWWSVIKYFTHAQIINAQNHKCTHARTQRYTDEANIRKQDPDTVFYLCWCDASGHAPREEHCFSHLTHQHTSTRKTHKPSEVTSVHFASPSVRSHAETLVQAASLEVNQGNQMCGACVPLNIWCVYNLGTHGVLAQMLDV